MSIAKKNLLKAAVALVVAIVNFFFASAILRAIEARCGTHVAYLVYFAYVFLPAAAVLAVKRVAVYVRHERKPDGGRAYARWLFVRMHLAPMLLHYSRWEHHQELRFTRAPWSTLRKYGGLAVALVTSIIAAPWVAAIFMRSMAVNERLAWIYVTLASVATTAVMVAGGLAAFKSFFG